MTHPYQPRGRLGVLFAFLRAQPPERVYSTDELAEIHGSPSNQMRTVLGAAIHLGAIYQRRMPTDGRRCEWSMVPFPDAEGPTVDAEPDGFDAALWADGCLTLVGAEVLPDGNVCLQPEQAARVKRLLCGEVV